MRRIGEAAVTACLLSLLAGATGAAAQHPSDAYADASARELVRLARLNRGTVDRRIETYSTTVHERFTASLRAGLAEKLLYRRETATRIHWERDGVVELEVLGMREVAPVASPTPSVPFDVSAEIPALAFDPGDADMIVRLEGTDIGHPLRDGSESDYRFAAGDTIRIGLPDGTKVTLRELRVIPRSRRADLFSGSLWLEAESHAVVRAQMRMARPFDADTDLSVQAEDAGLLGRIIARQLVGLVKPVRVNVDFLTLEYGLWESAWWLPRLAVARGVVQVGRFQIPIAYERTYGAYSVTGEAGGPLAARSDSIDTPCRPSVRFVHAADRSEPDTLRQGRAEREAARRERAQGGRAPAIPCRREYVVVAPGDSVLLHSSALPPDPFGDEFLLVGADELTRLQDEAVAGDLFQLSAPVLQVGLEGPGLTRYNRVEGLSTGARLLFEAGPMMLRPELRYGFSDKQVRGEFVVERAGRRGDWQLSAYRRLRSAVRDGHVHGTVSSLGALLLGRDDHQYYDARGADLLIRPSPTRHQWYEVQLFAERQAPAEQNTHFNLARVFDSDRSFLPNFTADSVDQIGANVRLRHSLGTNPTRPRVDVVLEAGAEVGDFDLVRREALVRTVVPLPLRVTVGVEAAAGGVHGDMIPAQAMLRLGGSSSLRGHRAGLFVIDRYERGRAEIGLQLTGLQVGLFADALKVASSAEAGAATLHWSTGFGVTQFGGLVRLDVARRMTGDGGWGLHVQVNRDF